MMRILRSLFIAIVFAAFLPMAASQSTSTYVLKTLDFSGASFNRATGINNNGDIVGVYVDSTGVHGYLYSQGAFQTLPSFPGAGPAQPWDINDTGQIVGIYQTPGSLAAHAFLYSTGNFQNTDVPNAFQTVAFGINDAGTIVGDYTDPITASMLSFPVSCGSYPNSQDASGINNAGQVVIGPGSTTASGFLYPSCDPIPAVQGKQTVATRINDKGQVVGYFVDTLGFHGFVLTGTHFTTLDFEGAIATFALGINNQGQVVGYYQAADQSFHGFVASNSACQVNVTPLWFQGDSRWASKTYDNYNPNASVCFRGDDTTNCRIKKLGCALTTLAMALNFAGGNTIPGTSNALNPGSLNDFMRLPNSYFTSNHDVDWDPTAHAVKPSLKFQTDFINSQSTDDLDQILCGTHYGKSLPAIVGIHLNSGKPQHFVLVTGKTNGQYQIIDPGDQTNTTLNVNNFVIRGVITDPIDNSAIDLSVGTNAEILLIDAAGRRTGFDATSGMTVQEITNSAHFIDSLEDDETGAPAVGASHFVDVAQPTNGTYVVKLSGLQLGEINLTLHTFGVDGSKQSDEQLLGVTGPGMATTFEIDYVSAPGSLSMIRRVASFDSTLGDVGNSLQLGLIDNSGIANSLAKKVMAAQDATGSARNNILNAFKNEVNAQSGKHINGIALQILIEDADSLISQNVP